MTPRGRILWFDDDGPARFRYAETVLKRDGWEVDWAQTGMDAVRKLALVPYQAILLDQEAPLTDSDPRTRWMGSLVLHWLRRSGVTPAGLPRSDQDFARRLEEAPSPDPYNRKARVVLVSDYDADELLRSVRGASEQDRDTMLLIKPIDLPALRSFLVA